MATPFQLISTDFDGTLFAEFEQPPVSIEVQRKIAELQQQGVRWVINTGRDMTGLMECIARARLTVQPDYLVLVEREIFVRAGARYLAHDPWNQACTLAHHRLFRRIRDDIPNLMSWVNDRFTATVFEDPFSPFCLVANNNPEADQIIAHLEDYCRTIPNLMVVRNDVYARLAHDSYTKGTALAEITQMLALNRGQVLAAGDHWNDLPMLDKAHAHYLVTPANAIEVVKQHVKNQNGFVSDQPYGSGVLQGICHYLNQEPSLQA